MVHKDLFLQNSTNLPFAISIHIFWDFFLALKPILIVRALYNA